MANSLKKFHWPKVFLFGDSITQFSFSDVGCWGALLADHLQRKCDVLSRGFSGYNTRWCKIILPSILDTSMAKDLMAVTIFLGANDACKSDLNPLQHVPLDEYRQNLKDMIEYCMNTGVSREKIIIISPPAFDEDAWGKECAATGKVQSREKKISELYSKASCEVGKEMGTQVVDLYSEMAKTEDFPSYLCDGLHLSQKGSKLLFKLLQPIMDQLTAGLPKALFPFWDEVDLDNLEESLLRS